MDTASTRPRARIGFMRGHSAGAGSVLDPSQAVAAPAEARRAPPLELPRDPLRPPPAAVPPPVSPPRAQAEPEPSAAAADDAFDEPPVVPQSLVRREPLPAESWLKRAFAAARIARYRKLTRRATTGRHEDVSV